MDNYGTDGIIFLATLGFVIPLFVIFWKLWKQEIKALLYDYTNDDFDKYGILLPSLWMMVLPFLIPTLVIRLGNSFWDFLGKGVFPVLTFVLGQYITQKESEKSKLIKDLALAKRIHYELDKNLKIINSNLESFSNSRNLETLDLIWWEQTNLYFELYFNDKIKLRKNDNIVCLKIELSRLFNLIYELNIQIKKKSEIKHQISYENDANNDDLVPQFFNSLVSELELQREHELCKEEIQGLIVELSKKFL
ncbi:hypothetical protein CLI64_04200 [Nostoc sp. CENA543]|uniref:hypothetical protein n=1 Tax=Nostoc sp. CENA543 TaxID=1869241 RepID=UPI000CA2E2A7|nr:hypothetical protein [Nostoc sp. CENA543]AUS99652.1 hypothetical protein CLI64_04200 [Nostoc sp. CENA543]